MTRAIALRLGVALFLFAIAVPVAMATDATIVADASVNAAHPNLNFGRLSNLYVSNGNTTLIRFDLSSLPTGTIAAQIGHAALRLYVNRVNAPGSINLQPVTSTWDELAVTNATLPALGPALTSFSVTDVNQYAVIDVTTLVQGWLTTPGTNYGIALSSAGANILFDSKENDETSHLAQLDITVTSQGPVGPAGPVGAAGAQGVQGAAGVAGISGPQGVQGPNGPVGATGASGATGAAGAIGPIGPAGAIGPTGLPGAPGATGAIGPQGALGPAGTTGTNGAAGATGPVGPQGAMGPTGATGAAGTFSSASNYTGATTYSQGQVVFCATACSTNGSSYVSLAGGNIGFDPPTSNVKWALIAQAGAAGTAGPQGPAGPSGPTGATGSTGPAGGGSHIFTASVMLGQANSSTEFFSLNSSNDPSNVGTFLTYNQFATTFPQACIFDSMFLTSSQSGFGNFGSPISITLFHNGVATSLIRAITPPSTNTLASAQITGQSVSIGAGDTVALQATSTSFATNGSFVPIANVSVSLHCQ